MTLQEKYHLVNMAELPFSETLAFSIELARNAEHIFIGITNGNSLLAYDIGKPTYNQMYDIAKTSNKKLAEGIYEHLLNDPNLANKHKMCPFNERSAIALYDSDNYTIFMLCSLK